MRRVGILLVVLVFLLVPVSAQSLPLSVDVPSRVEQGSSTTVNVSASIPDIPLVDLDTSLSISVLVDGQTVAQRTVTVTDGEEVSVGLEIPGSALDQSGAVDVTVKASVTLKGQTFTASQTLPVYVEAPTSVSPRLEPVTVEGAVFPAPESVETQLEEYAEHTEEFTGLAGSVFVLADDESLYVVIYDKQVENGYATVQGKALPSPMTWDGLDMGVVIASNVTVQTTGTPVSIEEVCADPSKYRLNLVRIDSNYRDTSLLVDMGVTGKNEMNFSIPVTAGLLTKEETPRLVTRLAENGKKIILEPEAPKVKDILEDPLGIHLHTFSFQTSYWTDTPATADAIVLDPQGRAVEYVRKVGQIKDQPIIPVEGEALLYLINMEPHAVEVNGVEEIKANPEAYQGKIVTFEANALGASIALQDTLEENTPPTPELFQVPPMPAPIDIPADVVLDTLIMWNTIPQPNEIREKTMLCIGASSEKQDVMLEPHMGHYRVTGRVITTSQLSDDLPPGIALLLYEKEKLHDLDPEELGEETRAALQDQVETLKETQTSQVLQDIAQEIKSTKPGEYKARIYRIPKEIPITLKPHKGALEQISIQARNQVSNASITIQTLDNLPKHVETPPRPALEYLEITTDITPDEIEHATITFNVRKSRLQQENIQPSQVVLARYHNQEWQHLPTTITSQNQTTIHYRAETPGFSTFAITTTKQTTEETTTATPTPTETTSTPAGPMETPAAEKSVPGYTAITGAIAALAAAYITRE